MLDLVAKEDSEMMKRMKWSAVVMLLAVLGAGVAALLLPHPMAKGGSCWQVDCNICCRTPGGGVVCTQRACV